MIYGHEVMCGELQVRAIIEGSHLFSCYPMFQRPFHAFSRNGACNKVGETAFESDEEIEDGCLEWVIW